MGFDFYWLCRNLHDKVGEAGKAVGIDHMSELVNNSIENLQKDVNIAQMLKSGRITMVTGDGRQGIYSIIPN